MEIPRLLANLIRIVPNTANCCSFLASVSLWHRTAGSDFLQFCETLSNFHTLHFSPLSLFKSLKDRGRWVWSKNHCVHVHSSQRIKILKSVILVNVLIHINMEFTAFWRFTSRDILYYIALLLNDVAVN